MIESLTCRTINNSGNYRDLSHAELAKLCTISLIQNWRNIGHHKLHFRGVSEKYLSDRLKNDGDTVSESEMLKRLFYFGDKSKHYFQENDSLKNSRYLKDIEDISPESNNNIFCKIRDLRKTKNPIILEFVKKNREFFDFFSIPENKSVFSDSIIKYGPELRDYYLAILHAAGNIGLGNKSTLISTSEDINVAQSFARGKREYIIFYFPRGRSKANSFKRIDDKSGSIPFLDEQKAIFPNQREITYRAGLFAHNMLGVLHAGEEVFTANPHIFSEENKNVNIATDSLFINQSNFEEELSKYTSYTRWNYTFDFNNFYHGGESS